MPLLGLMIPKSASNCLQILITKKSKMLLG